MQSLLEEITANPGLMEGLLWGPYVDTLLNCLGQNPDLAAMVSAGSIYYRRNVQEPDCRDTFVMKSMQNKSKHSSVDFKSSCGK